MRLMLLRAALLAAPFLVASCGNASSKDGADKAADAIPAVADDSAPRPTDMVLGRADAPVTLIEYASVTCPACAAFHETILPTIKEKYIDSGKVKLVFREYPTPLPEYSLIGSLLARCAAEKVSDDAYFLMIGSLFKNQRAWIYGADPKAELLKIAAQAGIDEPALDACLKRQDFLDLINRNTKEAIEKYKLPGVPSFLLNGETLKQHTQEDLEKALDEALAKTRE